MVAGETGQGGPHVAKRAMEGSNSGCATVIVLLPSMGVGHVVGVKWRRGAATLPPALWTVNGRSGQSGPPAPPAVREEHRVGAEPTSRSPYMEGRSAVGVILSRRNATSTSVLVRGCLTRHLLARNALHTSVFPILYEDACKPNPCFTGVECTTRPERTDIPICGPCPRGLSGDGLTCVGVDEVHSGIHICTHTCACTYTHTLH